jgi:two-component system, OmpR family, phosphate regulon sensor histidine kinase PhoR
MKSRLFFRIFSTYIVLIILAVAFFYLLAWQQIRSWSTANTEEVLMSYAQIVDLSSREEIQKQIDRIALISKCRITLIDETGKVLADTERSPAGMENHRDRPEMQEARIKGQGSAIRYSHTIGMDMIYVALPIRQGSAVSGYLRLARPLFEVKGVSEKLYRALFTSLLIMLVPSLLLASVFAYRLTSPIREMELFTERLRKNPSTSGTLIVRTGDELKQLADNINYLVQELQNQIRAANDEKEKLIAAFASMNEGVLILDRENKIAASNRAFKLMFAQYGDVTGKTLIEAFRNIELQNGFDQFKATWRQLSEEVMIGDPYPAILNVSFSKIQGEDEKTMVVFHDVTRLKRLEKMRVDFVANVSHEIKTPLTAILGFVETLKKGAIEDRGTALRFLDIIDKHAQRLNRLLEDLLTLSNIELGEMKFFFESVSLAGILENALPVIAKTAGEKKISLEKNIPEDLPQIRADRDRLVQILLNVLDNAVKFTPEGGKVSIRVNHEPDSTVSITISDTGIGVPRDEVNRLGERFYRVEKTRSRELGGTGLGLSIVKHLMAAHGGRMGIQSQLGQGTTVTLYFPVYMAS